MLKPLFLALIGCLGLSGCGMFTTSQTWVTVMRTRPDSNLNDGDSAAYAAKLHGVLKSAAVEHKVVTYEYHYMTHLREEAVSTHTAVLYRDDADQANPWWLMEDRLAKPVWLAGTNLPDQIAFYIHHDVAVVNEKDFPSNGEEHKATVAMARSANGYAHAGASHADGMHSEPSSNYFEIAAALPRSAVHQGSQEHSQKGAQQGAYASLFRSVHGTTYNPSSAMDRRKMIMLQNDALRHRQPPLASQTF